MKSLHPVYVGFGMLTPVAIMVVEQLPEHNTGALVKEVSEFVFDDAAIIACLLRQWEIPSAMIGTAVGDDPRGHILAQQLKTWGVQGEVRHSREIKTPWEVDVSDETGARTYFWERAPQVLNTLDTADLSLLEGAGLLYVDWYDGDHILRAMDEALRPGSACLPEFRARACGSGVAQALWEPGNDLPGCDGRRPARRSSPP